MRSTDTTRKRENCSKIFAATQGMATNYFKFAATIRNFATKIYMLILLRKYIFLI